MGHEPPGWMLPVAGVGMRSIKEDGWVEGWVAWVGGDGMELDWTGLDWIEMDGWLAGWMDGWMEGWTGGLDGWTDGRTDGQIDRQAYASIHRCMDAEMHR